MKIKLLLALSLITTSLVSYAGSIGVNYALKNTSLPYTNQSTIKVTGGFINYYFHPKMGKSLPAHCPLAANPITVDLSAVVDMPLMLHQGIPAKFTFTLDSSFNDCFTNSEAVTKFVITQVDDISKTDGVCQATNHFEQGSYPNTNMEIDESSDSSNFYCNIVMY